MSKYLPLPFLLFLTGCLTGPPAGLTAVDGFESTRYLGTWYEIARLDHSFERGLQNVTAEYGEGENGTITVKNRGYDPEKEAWDEVVGKAKFAGDPTAGRLKVSFFGPFYGGYNIIALDKENYQYAMVIGPTRKYFWILARTPELDASIYDALIEQAREAGVAVDKLIEVSHQPVP